MENENTAIARRFHAHTDKGRELGRQDLSAALGLDSIFVVSCGVPAPMGMTRGRMVRIKPGQGRG